MVVIPGNTPATVEDVRAFALKYRYQLTLGRQEIQDALNQENPNANITIPQFLFKLGIKQQRLLTPFHLLPLRWTRLVQQRRSREWIQLD